MMKVQLFKQVPVILRRNIGISAPVLQQDPVQQLFLEKIRDYKQKSSGGKLVEPTPELSRELKSELDRATKQYGGDSGEDMSKFPTFKFDEVKIEPINEQTA